MNLPNLLTAGRLALAAVLLALMSSEAPLAASGALMVFAVAAATDWLDGHLARSGHGITLLGQMLDPLADKVLVCAALVSFVEIRLPGARHPMVPAWIVVLILAREFLVTGLRILAMREGRDVSAGAWGKHKTIWQLAAILAMLGGLAIQRDALPRWAPDLVETFSRWLAAAAYVLALLVAGITVLSGLAYAIGHRDLLRPGDRTGT